MRRDSGAARPSLVLGAVLVAVGALLLAGNLGFLEVGRIWRYWPLILIGVGAARITEAHGELGKIWGGILVVAGSALLVDNLGIFHIHIWRYWPVLLIVFGVLFVLRATEGSRPPSTPPSTSLSTINDWAVFGGVERKIDSPEFRGGEAMSVFGGVKLDLSKASLGAPEVVIDCSCIFGGVEIRVPEDWTVSTQGSGIFGGFADKTVHPRFEGPQPPKLLIIKGLAIFGGVEVKN